MAEIGIHPDLISKVKWIARERSITPDVVVEEALRDYLRRVEQDKLEHEIQAFREMHSQLRNRYQGQFVAISDGRVVDADVDFEALHRRVRAQFGAEPVLIRRVEETPERELVFRSPRMIRET